MMGAGSHICSYVIEVEYKGKIPFYVGTFTIPRMATFHESEAAALAASSGALARFFADHFPDGHAVPHIVRAKLGSMIFIPDDYEWRRGA